MEKERERKGTCQGKVLHIIKEGGKAKTRKINEQKEKKVKHVIKLHFCFGAFKKHHQTSNYNYN